MSGHRRSKALVPEVPLGRDDHLMTWSSNLSIYRVNRFNLLDLGGAYGGARRKTNSYLRDRADELNRFDIVEELLRRNMIDVVRAV